MKIEKLSIDELRELYKNRLINDFPPSELRPLESMERLIEQGLYRCFCIRGEGEIAAYALFAVTKKAALLDYFAVDPKLRGRGVGSGFLRELKNISNDFGAPWVLIEAESEESAKDEDELIERKRRISFYSRCGCAPTGVFSLLFGVEYNILALPVEGSFPDEEAALNALNDIYRAIILPIAGSEERFSEVCSCFSRSSEISRDFVSEFGRSLTFLARSRKRYMGERLKEYGFSGPMYTILLYVKRHPGTTQDNISVDMYIDKSNVTRRINLLEELGYVKRETSPTDRRQNNLFLTPKGRAIAPLIRSYLAQWERSIAAPLSDDERQSLMAILKKMREWRA